MLIELTVVTETENHNHQNSLDAHERTAYERTHYTPNLPYAKAKSLLNVELDWGV